MSSKAIDQIQFNVRQQRARVLSSNIMRALRDYIPDAVSGRAADALMELFFSTDAEVITSDDRIKAGLSPRSEWGLTPEEHAAIDESRARLLRAPPTIYICAMCGAPPSPPDKKAEDPNASS